MGLRNRSLWRLARRVTNGFAALWLMWLIGMLLPMADAAAAQLARPAANEQPRSRLGASGLPLPRYVSLKSDKVNIRKGPGIDYRIVWVFRRAGLPVEVLKEYQGWRQIRDADGGTGWVYGPMLSGRRTALVLPWKVGAKRRVQTELWPQRGGKSRALAYVQAGVLVNIKRCDGAWCEVHVGDLQGFIKQNKLWGIYPGEQLN